MFKASCRPFRVQGCGRIFKYALFPFYDSRFCENGIDLRDYTKGQILLPTMIFLQEKSKRSCPIAEARKSFSKSLRMQKATV